MKKNKHKRETSPILNEFTLRQEEAKLTADLRELTRGILSDGRKAVKNYSKGLSINKFENFERLITGMAQRQSHISQPSKEMLQIQHNCKR